MTLDESVRVLIRRLESVQDYKELKEKTTLLTAWVNNKNVSRTYKYFVKHVCELILAAFEDEMKDSSSSSEESLKTKENGSDEKDDTNEANPWEVEIDDEELPYHNLMVEDIVGEMWKPIEGYENLYDVSTFGRIKSLKNYNKTGKPRMLKQSENGDGYLRINLWKNGEQKQNYVHRLVAKAFISNPEGLAEINHINECKHDNRVENLEWISHEDNLNYGTHNERVAKAKSNGKLSKPLLQFSLENGKLVQKWESSAEVERALGYRQNNISSACNKKYGREGNDIAYGYRWAFQGQC